MSSESIKRHCSILAVQGALALSQRCWVDVDTLRDVVIELGTSFELYDARDGFSEKPAHEQFQLVLHDLKLPDPRPDDESVLGGLGTEELLWAWLSYHTELLAYVLKTAMDEDELVCSMFSANQIAMALLATGAPGRYLN